MTRRRLLGGSAAPTGLVATGGGNEPIELGGQTNGWQGQTASDIEGQTNPTLSLGPGTTYDLTWENLDGQEHELIIEDANGNELNASDSSEEQGETVTLSSRRARRWPNTTVSTIPTECGATSRSGADRRVRLGSSVPNTPSTELST